ncbi:MAG: BrnA antitoxin family protein [Gemmatimonadetes bacterium]|nr:BrnA antitoxin family protein [Gemmatimonadota bacterium]
MRPQRTVKDGYDLSNAIRGPIIPPRPDTAQVSIPLDNDVLAWFRAQVHAAGGGNYQTLMNNALREHMSGATLEEGLRKVLREELGRGG